MVRGPFTTNLLYSSDLKLPPTQGENPFPIGLEAPSLLLLSLLI